MQIFDGLFEFDLSAKPPYKPVPRLVKNYTISPDGKVITLEVHKGVQFHHGYGELTSEDVVFSLTRHRDPKVASRVKAQLGDVERIEAVDKYTAKIYLKIPSALSLVRNLAWQNAGFILSKKATEKLGDKVGSFPIGTGPYYFHEWSPGEKVVLKKFDDFWGTPAKFDEIEFWVIPEETVALGALERGDLDVVAISQQGSYERAKRIKGIDVRMATAGAFQFICFTNHKMSPMNDLRVRRALAHALDMKGISDRLGIMVQTFPSPLPSAVFSATDTFWKYEYDLDKARKLLAEAGYPNGFELKMIYNRAFLYEPVTLEVANSWNRVVDVKLELVERAVYYKTVKEFKHHVAFWAITRFSPFLYGQFYQTGSGRNMGQYSNPELDEIITKGKIAVTEQESEHWWRGFQRVAIEDVAYYWPGVQTSLVAIRKDVKGVGISPYVTLFDYRKAYREE